MSISIWLEHERLQERESMCLTEKCDLGTFRKILQEKFQQECRKIRHIRDTILIADLSQVSDDQCLQEHVGVQEGDVLQVEWQTPSYSLKARLPDSIPILLLCNDPIVIVPMRITEHFTVGELQAVGMSHIPALRPFHVSFFVDDKELVGPTCSVRKDSGLRPHQSVEIRVQPRMEAK